MLAAVLSLPKQFITVYIGAMLESDPNCESLPILSIMSHLLTYFTASTGSTRKIIADVVGVITLLVTVVAMWYINEAVRKVKPQVIQERQKSRSVPLHAKRRLTTYDFTLQLS